LFVTGIVDTGDKFVTAWYQQHQRNWWQNLPPVSLSDTGGKFAAGVADTGGKFGTVVVLIPELLLDLLANISQISKKFKMTLVLFSGAWGKMIDKKKI
jgi:hypothetical protein